MLVGWLTGQGNCVLFTPSGGVLPLSSAQAFFALCISSTTVQDVFLVISQLNLLNLILTAIPARPL